MRMSITVRYHHPVERVFPYLAEPERWPTFVPGATERTRIGEGPVAPGTRWKAVDRVGPMRVSFIDEMVEIEPNSRVSFRHSSPWNGTTTFKAAGDGEGTTVEATFEGSPSGKLRWMDLIPDSAAAGVFEADLKRLGAVLDQ